MHIKREQLKWFYSGITGFCAVFFISLFSFYSGDSVSPSPFLIVTITCFSAALPIFAACAIVHIGMVEDDISNDVAFNVLDSEPAQRVTFAGLLIFLIGLSALIFYFDAISGFVFMWVSIYMARQVNDFRNKYLIEESACNKKVSFEIADEFYTSTRVTYGGHTYHLP